MDEYDYDTHEPYPLPRPPGIKLIRQSKCIGPREDPYDLTTRTVEFVDTGRRVTLESDSFACALRLYGDNLGVKEGDFLTTTSGTINDEFISLTGLDAYSFDAHYYDEGGEGYLDSEVQQAELAAGWDPNP